MTDAVPFTVVGGYLGAGKTTLVNRILTGDHGRRIAVIVNDFGDVAVDLALLEPAAGSVRALANGCVCCTLSDGFAATLAEIRALDPRPEHVLVEVSGVGDPWAVAQWGRTPGFGLDGVVVVADPETIGERADDRYVGETVTAQLRSADLVLLSRADVVDAGVMDAAEAIVSGLSEAPVLRGADVPLDVLLGRPAVGAAATGPHAEHRSWSWMPEPVGRADLAEWLAAAPAGVVRVKGVVDTPEPGGGQLVGQLVGRRVEVTRRRDAPPAEPAITAVATPAVDESAVEEWMLGLGP